jgi:Flp pilus assembly protein protease CpaA
MEVAYSVLAVLLVGAAYQDYERRKVSDILTAALWVFAFFFGLFHANYYLYLVCFFSGYYLFNALAAVFKPAWLVGWCDVLILPVWASTTYYLTGMYGILLSGIIAFGVCSYFIIKKKVSAPLVLGFAVAYALSYFAAFLFGIQA